MEWERDSELHEGVYIPRRDTSSKLNTLAGARIFPGVHHHAQFQIDEHDGHFSVVLDSDDGETHVAVQGHVTDRLPAGSVFTSVEEASDFFERGSLRLP